MKNVEVTAEVSTKDRYYTTLPMCIVAIANQTHKPKKILIFDDGEQKDLRNDPTYASIFGLLFSKGIDFQVIFGQKKGQVANHQIAIGLSQTEWIWRVDDDDVPEPNVLEILVRNIKDDVGVISGLVLIPGQPEANPASTSGRIEDIFTSANVQWSRFKGVKEVDHMNNTFLFRKSAATHGYCLKLSPAGHREETMFTYEFKRKGFKLLVDPEAIIWHMRSPQGGIRSYTQEFFWEHDEMIFHKYLEDVGISVDRPQLIVLDSGLGDHYAFKMIMPEIKAKYKNLTLAVCYPEVFEDEGVRLISIAEAYSIGVDKDKHNVYKFMTDRGWTESLVEAYRKMWL
jgi:GT2 family glycosyltransferase